MDIPLYEADLNIWFEETLIKLKERNIEQLDFEHLIEEIAALAGRDRRELQNRLTVLIEHLLKRKYVDSFHDLRGWELTIKEQLRQIELLLKQSPSLKRYLIEVLPDCCEFALSQVQILYPQVNFPTEGTKDIDVFLKLVERDLAAFQLNQ